MADDTTREEKDTPTLDDLAAQVAQVDAEAFATALQKKAHSHYQLIFNAGHRTATAQQDAKLEPLQKQLQQANEQAEAYQAKIEELSEQAPDLEAIQAKYQKALQQKDQEWEAKLKAEQSRADQLETSIREGARTRLLDGVKDKLLDMGILDSDYARIKAHDPALAERIKVEGERATVYQKDGMTPYSVPEGESVADILAREIFATVPKPLIRDNRPGSTGHGQSNGQGGAASVKKSDLNTPEKKAEFIEAHGGRSGGFDAYHALPD